MSPDYDSKICPRCGARADASATACPFCGEPMPLSPSSPSYDDHLQHGEDTVILPDGAQQPSPYGRQPYGRQPYEQPAYEQPAYEQPAYGQPLNNESYQSQYQPAPKKSKGKGNFTLTLVMISLASLIIAGVVTFFVLEYLNKGEEATYLPDTASVSVTAAVDSMPTNASTSATLDEEVAAEAAAFEENNDIEVVDQDHIAALANRLQIRSRELTKADLAGLNVIELRYLRNYIFAQYGLIFQDEEMREFFFGYSWYTPKSTDVSGRLSPVEKKNVMTIESLE